MLNKNKQQGMTMISMLALAAMIGFLLLIAIKLFPLYMAQFKISSALEGLITDSRVKGADSDDIKNLILKKLQVDDVDHITEDDINIIADGAARVVRIDYEARTNVLANVDVVVVFKDNMVRLGN